MDLQLIMAAGIAVGTILLFAAVGEILAERAGVLNLGVEGMMLIGAVVGYATAVSTGNPWPPRASCHRRRYGKEVWVARSGGVDVFVAL